MKKNIYRMMLTVVASVLLLPLGLAAQTRIAVVSDIHIIDPAPQTTPDGQRKMLDKCQDLFEQFVGVMEEQQPDILLITGDLTENGDQASHNYVVGKLNELVSTLKDELDKNIKVFVIPGNHDCSQEGSVIRPNVFATTYANFGYDSGSTRDENSLSYVAEPVQGLVLLAIDSHSGSVESNTLDWLCAQAQAARADGKRVIAMMHHPLFPHIVGGDMFVDSYTVKFKNGENETNYESVRNALINAGVNVILTGHFHTSDIAYDWNNDETNGIYDINTGSLVSYPCDYRMLTLSADKTTLNVTTESLTETEDLKPIGSKGTKISWKDWLHERMAAKALTAMENKINSLTGVYYTMAVAMATDEVKNNIASLSADLFVLHAEGNENLSENTIMDAYNDYMKDPKYVAIFSYAQLTDATLKSILYDTSNYDNDNDNDNSHANKTNDRTLTIDLDHPSELLIDINNGSENKSSIDYYNTKTANVTLTGRTLYKDGKWNTLCLPFDMSLDNETLEGCTLKELDVTGTYDDNGNASNDGSNRTGFDANTGVLSLYFKDANSIVAGTPYLIKWEDGNDIDNPTFSNVTISNADNSVTIGEGSNSVSFLGTYNAKAFDTTDKSILLVGVSDEGSTLYYPEEGASIGACRAYFKIGEDGAQARAIKAFNLNFGDNNQTTGIENIQGAMAKAQSGVWYTLNGMKLSQQPIRKGLYIHNGKKVAVE